MCERPKIHPSNAIQSDNNMYLRPQHRKDFAENLYFRLSKISFNLFSKEKLLLSLPGGKIRWDGLPDIEETSDSSNPHNFTKQDIKNWTQLDKIGYNWTEVK